MSSSYGAQTHSYQRREGRGGYKGRGGYRGGGRGRGGGNSYGRGRGRGNRYRRGSDVPSQEALAILCPDLRQLAAKSQRSPPQEQISLVDIGFNISSRQFNADLNYVLERARLSGVSTLVCTGTSIKASRQNIQLCLSQSNVEDGREVPKLVTTVGVHPHDAKSIFPDVEQGVQQLRTILQKNSSICVAVGECGLDYNRMFSPREQQIACFEKQLQMARELKLPVFMHEREAFQDAIACLERYKDVVEGQGVVVHCFTGTREEACAYVKLGCYIGVTGFICMQNRGRHLRSFLAEEVPIDRLMLETDAPFMTPELFESTESCLCEAIISSSSEAAGPTSECIRKSNRIFVKRNEPGALIHVCHVVANCYNLPLSVVAARTTATALEFFGVARR